MEFKRKKKEGKGINKRYRISYIRDTKNKKRRNTIKNPKSKGVKQKMEGNKYLKQAMEELEYLSSEPDFQRLVEAREGFLRDQEAFEDAGIKKGIKRGIKKGRREIAKELIKKNMTVKEIAEITKLTENEIKKLKQQLK